MTKSIEKHSFNISIGIAVVVIISLLTMAFNFATWKTHIEDQHFEISKSLQHLYEDVIALRNDVEEQEEVNNLRALETVVIKGQLANITAIVLEIKNNLKR